jgi:hypothetical protein
VNPVGQVKHSLLLLPEQEAHDEWQHLPPDPKTRGAVQVKQLSGPVPEHVRQSPEQHCPDDFNAVPPVQDKQSFAVLPSQVLQLSIQQYPVGGPLLRWKPPGQAVQLVGPAPLQSRHVGSQHVFEAVGGVPPEHNEHSVLNGPVQFSHSE